MNIKYKQLDTGDQLKLVFSIFVLFCVIEIANLLTGRILNQMGNLPRHVPSLPGIFIGPFLHGSLHHFVSNIVPFCVFSFLLLQYGSRRYLLVTSWIILSTGLLVWLFGRNAVHVGISGVIYGYFGYLLLAGFISGRPKLILISLLIAFFYGGMVFGVLPSRPFVSWESHLFGFVSGLLAAKWWAKDSKATI